LFIVIPVSERRHQASGLMPRTEDQSSDQIRQLLIIIFCILVNRVTLL